MTDLSNRVHIFAHPRIREKLIDFFILTLGCKAVVSPEALSGQVPIIAFVFANGASLSVEFTDEALDEKQALRGAYLELRTDDPSALQKKVVDAGLPEVRYFGTEYFYFAAPGGQVMRIAPIRER